MTKPSQVFEPLLVAGDLDKTVHEPARLMMLSILYVIDRADFVFLHKITGLTRGNFSTHMSKLEEAGYIKVDKEFVNRRPLTVLSITTAGRSALENYKTTMKGFIAELE
jgi:DNA-binding MarR family transcriptional regulator